MPEGIVGVTQVAMFVAQPLWGLNKYFGNAIPKKPL